MQSVLRFAIVLAGLIMLQAKLGAGEQVEQEKRTVLAADRDRLLRFEQQLDQLRELLKIPGLSAAVVRDQTVLWARGFGFADRDKCIPATPDTPYHVASLTKTFAATLLMRLVEQGKVDLDRPASRYCADIKDDRVTIRHLLTHTSQGTPGERFLYDGDNYWYLTEVIEKASGKSFRQLMVTTFLEPLHMTRSVPGHDVLIEGERLSGWLGPETIRKYREVLHDLARPYHLYGSEEVVANPPYRAFTMSGMNGLISSVRDLAKYDAAIDRHQLIRQETQERAWTPAVSNSGQPLPHGMGWFVQRYRGVKLVWHFGYWPDAFSAMLLKVPERNLTLILLANSDGLSAPFYENWGVETSMFANCFLRLFVFQDGRGRTPPDPSWPAEPNEFSRELARLRKQTDYPYAGEELSHAAMTKWLAERRARAHTPIRVSPDRLADYVGDYRLRPDRVVTVKLEGDSLTIDFPGQTRFAVLPWEEGKFFLKILDLELTFTRDENGRVRTLKLMYEGRSWDAKKVD